MNVKRAVYGAVVIMTWAATVRGADVFYDQRFEAGKAALASQRHLEAAEQLRIAAFGFLDEPKRLSETLAMLTIAHAALGRTAEVEIALQRFVEIEKQFGAYNGNALDPALRTRFEAILVRALPTATLAAIPTLASLLQPAPAPNSQRKNPAPVTPRVANATPPQNPAPKSQDKPVPAPAPASKAPTPAPVPVSKSPAPPSASKAAATTA